MDVRIINNYNVYYHYNLMDYEEAILYCQFLDIDGYGWRLPTYNELHKVFNNTRLKEKHFVWALHDEPYIYSLATKLAFPADDLKYLFVAIK